MTPKIRHRAFVTLALSLLVMVSSIAVAGEEGWVELRPGTAHPYDLQVEESGGVSTVRLRVHRFLREPLASAKSRFESVTVPGSGSLSENGRPELPTFAISLLLAADAEIVAVEAQTTFVGGLIPAPRALRPKRCSAGATARLTCDVDLYNGVEAYPESSAELVQRGRMRGQPAVVLELRPFRYLPGQRGVEVAMEMTVTLSSPLSRMPNERLYSRSFDLLSRGRFHQLLGPSRDDLGKELILLVVNDDLLSSVDEFVAWKEAMGYAVVVMPLSEAGDSHVELKATLQEAYDSWSLPPTYVVLVGDGNGAGKVPFVPSPYGCASDFLFTTLDGDDLYSDVLIGRISAHTVEEASEQLGKAVWYERDLLETGDGDWIARSICISSSEGSGGSNDDVRSDLICDLQMEHGFSLTDKLYHSNGLDKAALISAKIEEGRGWLTYLGHGSGHSWSTTEPPYGVLEVAALLNNYRLPFVVDVSCSNGEFDSNSGDCFAEVWMKAGGENGPRAAVAIYSASMVTPWDEPAEMAVGMAKAALMEGIYNWGALAAAGRSYMMEAVPGGSHEEVCHQYVVFGDPSLQVRTTQPMVLAVTHPAVLPLGSFPFDVAVTSSGQPVAGASVALSLPGGSVVVAKTGADGTVQMEVVAGVVGTAFLTVTTANAVPYVAELETLVPGCGLLQVGPAIARCEEELEIQLFDGDLNLSPVELDEVVVSAQSTSDPQGLALTLVEVKPDGGKFVGSSTISALAQSGSLLVEDLDTVTVSYTDELCDDGAGVKTFDVVVDCKPPALAALAFTDILATSAVATFTTDEVALGVVRYGVAEPLSEEAYFGPGKSHTVTLSGLAPDSDVLVAVAFKDVAGNESLDDNGGEYYILETLPCLPECNGVQCGPDGCGGVCGTCCENQTCEAGGCVGGPGCQVASAPTCGGCLCEDCVCDMDPYCCQVVWDDLCVDECLDQCGGCGSSPDCGGKECGANGCGGSCGTCLPGWFCNDAGECVGDCTPDCSGKDCGADGCGGKCGLCGIDFECVEGVCLEECGGVDFVGCCDGDIQFHCEDGFQLKVDCGALGLTCGWKSTLGWYDCDDTQQADPSGTFPLWCPGVCPPECEGKQCGPDGCGGSCGECGAEESCVNAVCKADCEPQCAGIFCGEDGCGGQCGECAIGLVCEAGLCVEVCAPQCGQASCGDDGCGGSCGYCAAGMSCSSGQCVLATDSYDVLPESDVAPVEASEEKGRSGACAAGGRTSPPDVALLLLLLLLVVVSRRTSQA